MRNKKSDEFQAGYKAGHTDGVWGLNPSICVEKYHSHQFLLTGALVCFVLGGFCGAMIALSFLGRIVLGG